MKRPSILQIVTYGFNSVECRAQQNPAVQNDGLLGPGVTSAAQSSPTSSPSPAVMQWTQALEPVNCDVTTIPAGLVQRLMRSQQGKLSDQSEHRLKLLEDRSLSSVDAMTAAPAAVFSQLAPSGGRSCGVHWVGGPYCAALAGVVCCYCIMMYCTVQCTTCNTVEAERGMAIPIRQAAAPPRSPAPPE